MKTHSVLYALGMVAVLFSQTACTTKETDTLPQDDNRKAAITFGMPATSRSIVNDAEDMESFYVWAWTSRNGETRPLFKRLQVKYNSGTWQPVYEGENQEAYWIDGTHYTFYAASGIGPGAEVLQEGTLKEAYANKLTEDAADLMTSDEYSTDYTYQAGNTPDAVKFQFKHELARIRFTVKAEEGVNATVTAFTLSGCATEGTLTHTYSATANPQSLWEGVSTPEFSKDGLSLSPDTKGTDLLTAAYGNRHTPLFLPQAVATQQLALTYNQDGENKTTTLPLSQGTVDQWKAGQSYNYTFVILPTHEIEFEGVTVDAWEDNEIPLE